jgi:cation:H+ antiporter
VDAGTLLQFGLGLVLLVTGAESLVRGSARLAASVGVPPLIIGLTVVAFGTSSPEIVVSVQAALADRADIALGNVIGSNIFNVLFILGLSAIVAPLVVSDQLVRYDVPIMIGASSLVMLLGMNGSLGRLEGLLLLTLLALYIAFLVWLSRRRVEPRFAQPPDRATPDREAPDRATPNRAVPDASVTPASEAAPRGDTTTGDAVGLSDASAPAVTKSARKRVVDLLLIVAGLGTLVIGSHSLVESSVSIARFLGLSELVIGLTIVAAGTSLPEVATSVIASIRRERDIAVGNIVGSNIFNLLAVLGTASLLAPRPLLVSAAALTFDLPVMVAVAMACLPIFFAGLRIPRWIGALFLAYYCAYVAFLVLDATDHEALPIFSGIMLSFVVPLTVVTLSIVLLKARARERAQ